MIYDTLDHASCYPLGTAFQKAVEFVKRLDAATPDGRHRGDALSRNNVATAGCGKEGPLALMRSNLKLDQTEAPDGHIIDVMLPLSITKRPTAAQDIANTKVQEK